MSTKAWVVFEADGSDETGAVVNIRAVILDPELARSLIDSPDCGRYKSFEVQETVVMTDPPRTVPILRMNTYFGMGGSQNGTFEVIKDSEPLMPHEQAWPYCQSGGVSGNYTVSGPDHDEVRRTFAAEVERRQNAEDAPHPGG